VTRAPLTLLSVLLVIQGCGRAPQAPNLVLITIDTLRADHLSCYGYRRATSKHIDRLAREGLLMENVYTAVPITAPSHATLLTGRYPLRHGVRTNGLYILDDQELTLAEILSDLGYATAAFVGAVPVARGFGFAQGFQTFDDDFSSSELRGHDTSPWYRIPLVERERRAAEVIDPALAWLGARDGTAPFFLWVHLFDPHTPYAPPAPYDVAYRRPEAASLEDGSPVRSLAAAVETHAWMRGLSSVHDVVALYDGEITYTDDQLGRLLEALDALDLRDDTVVAVTADHGEGLGEHDEWFWHGDQVYETTARIPLVVRAPGRVRAGERSSLRIRSVDLLPSLLTLLDVEPPDGLDGRSFLADLDGGGGPRPVLIEAAYRDRSGDGLFAYREHDIKVIVRDPSNGRPGATACFDLATDPNERRDSCSELTDSERLVTALAAERERLGRATQPEVSVPQDVMDALRSLGYQGD